MSPAPCPGHASSKEPTVKLRVDRDVLAEAVTWTARSVPVRPPVPVLAGVRLEADESSLVLASFDYEVSARCQVPAEAPKIGRASCRERV